MEPASSGSEDVKCVTSNGLAISSAELEDKQLDANRGAVSLLRTGHSQPQIFNPLATAYRTHAR